MLGQDGPARLGHIRRTGMYRRAIDLHEELAVRLLVERGPHHPDLEVDPEERAGECQRTAPLTGAGLGGELAYSFARVVVRLRHRSVGLMRASRADAFVLVVDPGGRAKVLLKTPGAEQGRRPPEPVDIKDRFGNRDVLVAGDF